MTTLILMIGALAGPIALAVWLCLRRALTVPVATYVALAPIDFLLTFSGGTTLTRFISFAALAALGVTILRDGPPRHVPRFAIAWAILAGWMIASLWWATDQAMGLTTMMQIGLAMLVFFLVAVSYADRTDLRVLVGAVIGSGAAYAVYAAVAHPINPRATNDRLYLSNGAYGVDPNGFCAALVPALALCTAAACSPGPRWRRIGGGALVPVIVYAMFETGSRGGTVAIGAILLWTLIRARYRLMAWLSLASAAVLVALQGGILKRFTDGDSGGAGRTDIWNIGIHAFRDHWAFGSGIGTFPDAYNSAYLLVPHTFHVGWSRVAHNLLVQTFTELGIVGGILLLYVFWRQFRELATIARDDYRDGWLRLGLECATIGAFVAAQFIDVLYLKWSWSLPILIAVVSNVTAREAALRARSIVASSGQVHNEVTSPPRPVSARPALS